MAKAIMSIRKANVITNGLFLVALAVVIFTGAWWPGVLIAIWFPLALRQYLTGRIYDMTLTTVILLGLFIVSYFNVSWNVLVPIIFVIGGIYIIFREYFFAYDTNGEDKSEELKEDADLNRS